MNIIALFEHLKIEKGKLTELTAQDIIRIEKQIKAEIKLESEIDANAAAELLDALKHHLGALRFIVENRLLYNFFAGTTYTRTGFKEIDAESEEHVRSLIGRYLEDDMMLKIDRELTMDRYDYLSDVMTQKDYFPDAVLMKIRKRMLGKIDFSVQFLKQHAGNQAHKIVYIRYRSFYEVLSAISSLETDERIKSLLNVLVDIYNRNNENELAYNALSSMSTYAAYDSDLFALLQKNRSVVMSPAKKSSGNLSGRSILVIVLLVIKFIVITSKCASGSSSSVNYNTSADVEDIQETYQNLGLSNDTRREAFHNYLAGFAQNDTENRINADTLKNGIRKFGIYLSMQSDMTGRPGVDSIVVKNNTDYDLVLLKHIVVQEKITMPSAAYFVKRHSQIYVDQSENYDESYSFYFGNDPAIFGPDAFNYRSDRSHNEFRFATLPDDAREMLGARFKITSDLEISKRNKKVTLKSKYLSHLNGLGYGASTEEFTFGETPKATEEVVKEQPN